MLDSNLSGELIKELLCLVPDAFDDPTEFWRVVPDTLENFTYSVSSKRDILIRHTSGGKDGRKLRSRLWKGSGPRDRRYWLTRRSDR